MIGFLVQVLLFFLVYHLGKAAGKVEERFRLSGAIKQGEELYNKVIKLAELKGEDVNALSNEEIARRIAKLHEDTKDDRHGLY